MKSKIMVNQTLKSNERIKNTTDEKAITLVALVVTIVVLLILAGITINMLFSDNGIIKQAQKSEWENNHGTIADVLRLKLADEYVANLGQMTTDEMLNYLTTNRYIDSGGIVNVQIVVGQKLTTGNGTNGTDVYKIKEGILYYINNNGEELKIDSLFQNVSSGKEEPTPEDYFDFDPDTGTISLKGATYYLDMAENNELDISKIVIPSTYKGQAVKRIGYIDYKNINEVIIPEGIEIIGESAFGWTKITNIKLPNTIKIIEDFAFANCYLLEQVNIPNSVNTIKKGAFWNCDVPQISIPNSVSVIEASAFAYWQDSQIIYVDFISKPTGWNDSWTWNHDIVVWKTE